MLIWAITLKDGTVVWQRDGKGNEIKFGSIDLTKAKFAGWYPVPKDSGAYFEIKLNDFRMEYYEEKLCTGEIGIETKDGKYFVLEGREGNEIDIGEGAKIIVVRRFDNFKISIRGDEREISDAPGPAENPAVEVELIKGDGVRKRRFVFERFAGHEEWQEDVKLSYSTVRVKGVKDYFSDLEIIKDGQVVLRKTIEVNDPLHYGGYHFYQNSYGREGKEYTVLGVASDSGLRAVYAGYWLLCGGAVVWLWLEPVRRRLFAEKSRPKDEGDTDGS